MLHRRSNNYHYGVYGSYGKEKIPIVSPLLVEGESRQGYVVFGDTGYDQRKGSSYASYFSLCSAYPGCEDASDSVCNAANNLSKLVAKKECIDAVAEILKQLNTYAVPSSRSPYVLNILNKFLHGHNSDGQTLKCDDKGMIDSIVQSIVDPKDANGASLRNGMFKLEKITNQTLSSPSNPNMKFSLAGSGDSTYVQALVSELPCVRSGKITRPKPDYADDKGCSVYHNNCKLVRKYNKDGIDQYEYEYCDDDREIPTQAPTKEGYRWGTTPVYPSNGGYMNSSGQFRHGNNLYPARIMAAENDNPYADTQ